MLHAMTVLNLSEVEQAVRASWGADTCDPDGKTKWQPENPALGQCGTTALVIQDLIGGDLILGEVHREGEKVDNHYWIRFGSGIDLDLTREQFRDGQLVVGGEVVHRPRKARAAAAKSTNCSAPAYSPTWDCRRSSARLRTEAVLPQAASATAARWRPCAGLSRQSRSGDISPGHREPGSGTGTRRGLPTMIFPAGRRRGVGTLEAMRRVIATVAKRRFPRWPPRNTSPPTPPD